MKYKPGDRVKIRTWKDMWKEYGTYEKKYITCKPIFTTRMEEELNRLNTNRIVTIKEIFDYSKCYTMKEVNLKWSDDMIECLASEYKIPEPIYTRFEILDL